MWTYNDILYILKHVLCIIWRRKRSRKKKYDTTTTLRTSLLLCAKRCGAAWCGVELGLCADSIGSSGVKRGTIIYLPNATWTHEAGAAAAASSPCFVAVVVAAASSCSLVCLLACLPAWLVGWLPSGSRSRKMCYTSSCSSLPHSPACLPLTTTFFAIRSFGCVSLVFWICMWYKAWFMAETLAESNKILKKKNGTSFLLVYYIYSNTTHYTTTLPNIWPNITRCACSRFHYHLIQFSFCSNQLIKKMS